MTQTKAELINGKGDVTFDTNTLFIDAVNNRVGIATTSPATTLNVQASAGEMIRATVSSNIGLYANIGADGNGGWFGSNADLAFKPSGTERARIDSSGRLLVGTSSARNNYRSSTTPTIQLEETADNGIAHFVNTNTVNGPFLWLGKSRGTTIGSNTIVQNDDSLGAVRFNGADGINVILGAQIAANVDGTPGVNDLPTRLVFFTTADGAASPTERMRIGSTGRIDNISRDAEYGINSATSASAGTTASVLLGAYGSTGFGTGTISFRVWSNGNVVNTNNSYGSISDIKLKENIVDADSQWDDLKALQVRNYNFKEGQTHTQIGLVAQEVELVSPGLVSESPDRDAEGNDLGTVTKSVNYSVLYMKAVKALQEAMERIEQLETEMAAVKAQLS